MTAHVTDLIWRGTETVEKAAAALAHRADISLSLPPSFHHAVATRLSSPAASPPLEAVDVSGGADLLGRLATIRGLEGLAGLEAPVARMGARVRVMSPSPTVAIRFASGTNS
jgi:hypothetical protein